jgi:hypothetical protein
MGGIKCEIIPMKFFQNAYALLSSRVGVLEENLSSLPIS